MAQMIFEQTLVKWFLLVFNMSLTSCVVILAVLLARLLLKRAPKIFSYALWAAVLFRLLCPLSFSLPISLLGALQNEPANAGRMEYVTEAVGYMEKPEITLPAPGLSGTVNEMLPPATPAASVNPMQIYLIVCAYIWLIGILSMGIYSGASLWKLQRGLKDAVHEKENIYRFQGKGSPFVYGLLSPHIYLPEKIDEEERAYLLLHEQIHIKRGDAIFRLMAFLALWLHWFNPLVWIAFALSGRDMEMSCDEAVILRFGGKVKKEYSASLLNMAAGNRMVRGVPKRIPTGIPLAFGESDAKSRIKNVLRYRKPKTLLIGVAAVFSVILAVFFLANPAKEKRNMNIFYGIVTEVAGQDNAAKTVVRIPRIGDVELPEADDVSLYLERDAEALILVGDLLRITFSPDLEITTETASGGGQTLWRFVSVPEKKAEKIQVMGEGFSMTKQADDRYLFGVPLGMANEAQAGNILHIYHIPNVDVTKETYFLEENAEQEQFASAEVLSVDKENYDIWVELTEEEVAIFLSEFGFGITAGLETAATSVDTEDFMEGRVVTPTYTDMITEDTGSELLELSPELLRSGELLDGMYVVYVRSISRSARGFDKYVTWEEETDLPLFPFAENCGFRVNRQMDKLSYEEVDFDTFADLVTEAVEVINPMIYCEVADNQIVRADLDSAWHLYGISHVSPKQDTWVEDMASNLGMTKEEVLAEYYVLAGTEEADIADGIANSIANSKGEEKIEIYTGNIGDGESGIVLFRDAAGNALGTEFAHAARAGWNNVYLGKADGVGFILTVHIEDRDTYGGYSYQVFRLGEAGGILQIAGSSFDFGGNHRYDDALFRTWADNLSYYLERSHLILGSQEGEIRTEKVSEADKYNYETLRREP